jgi:hypothetical protein
MAVRRKSGQQRLYYYCSRLYKKWLEKPCTFRSFVPGNWDESVWDCIWALLSQEDWVEQQIGAVSRESESVGRLIKTEEKRVLQLRGKIARVRDGYEGGMYGLEEAKARIAGYEADIHTTCADIERLARQTRGTETAAVNADALREELKALAELNLDNAGFEERRNLVEKLDIRVYPSEDLKTVRIRCGLGLVLDDSDGGTEGGGCGIVTFGLPLRSKSRTPTVSLSAQRGGIGTV